MQILQQKTIFKGISKHSGVGRSLMLGFMKYDGQQCASKGSLSLQCLQSSALFFGKKKHGVSCMAHPQGLLMESQGGVICTQTENSPVRLSSWRDDGGRLSWLCFPNALSPQKSHLERHAEQPHRTGLRPPVATQACCAWCRADVEPMRS